MNGLTNSLRKTLTIGQLFDTTEGLYRMSSSMLSSLIIMQDYSDVKITSSRSTEDIIEDVIITVQLVDDY